MSGEANIPDSVAMAVGRRWPDVANAWVRQAPRELQNLLEQYGAHAQQVLPARFGFVVAATTERGPLVFRSSPDPAAAHQAWVAQALARLGVSPAIHEIAETDTGVWTVMDKVLPGTSMFEAAPSNEVIAGILAVLRPMIGQPAPPGVPSLSGWLRERLDSPDPDDLPPGRDAAPEEERARALNTLGRLDAHGVRRGLCHADMSPGNILIGDRRMWLIDARGLAGEVEYDTGVLALKAANNDPDVAGPLACELAGQLDLDPKRASAWVIVASAARV